MRTWETPAWCLTRLTSTRLELWASGKLKVVAVLTGSPPQGVDDGPQGGCTVDHGRETGIPLQRHRPGLQRKSLLQGGQEDDFWSEGSGDLSFVDVKWWATLLAGDIWEVWQEQRWNCEQGWVCQCAQRWQRYCWSSAEVIHLNLADYGTSKIQRIDCLFIQWKCIFSE